MPRLKKISYFQKSATDRLKVHEDEKHRIKEHQKSIEIRRARQEIEGIQRKENEYTTQGCLGHFADTSRTHLPKKNKEQVEESSKKVLNLQSAKLKNQLSGKKCRKKTVKYTFDELLNYIRLGRGNKHDEDKVLPEEMIVPVDVVIEEEVEMKEESVDETKEDEGNREKMSAVFVKEEIKQDEDAEEIADLDRSPAIQGALQAGKREFLWTGGSWVAGGGVGGGDLKLQMEAKLVALNARGGLGSCPRGLYQCLFCGERMLTRNCLNLHTRTHVAPSSRASHMRTLPAAKKHACGVCGRGYSRKDYVERHVRRAHAGSVSLLGKIYN